MQAPTFPQAHDPRALLSRWRRVARAAGLRWQVLAEVDGEGIPSLERQRAGSPLIYLSSGVHGDEAAAAWGLLAWAEENIPLLKAGSFLICPCLNPHGLRANTRADQRGLDLNRRFHLDDDPVCGPWRQLMNRPQPPALGICLHEDYDAAGCYVYELDSHLPPMGAACLRAAAAHVPVDMRRTIDGRRACDGVIRRSRIPRDLPGLPEAVILWRLGCPRTLTFETPSEAALGDRVRAHAAFIHAAVRLVQEARP